VVSQKVLVQLSHASVEAVEFADRPEPVKMYRFVEGGGVDVAPSSGAASSLSWMYCRNQENCVYPVSPGQAVG
jgi:hypothetical protein